jgi:putative endopeptidase
MLHRSDFLRRMATRTATTVAFLVAGTVPAQAQAQAPAADVPLGFSLASMDRKANPRQNFYRYAVGGWLDRTAIPASESDVGGFTALAANLDARLIKLVRDAADAKAEPGSPRQQIGDYWRAAMDLKRLDDLGLKPLQADLDRIAALGLPAAAPVLGELSARLQLAYGVSPLVNAFVGTDLKDSKSNLLLLVAGQQSLTPDEYAKPEGQPVRNLYLTYISRMLQTTGMAPADADAGARAVLAMEAEISASQLTPLQGRDPAFIYNLMTLAQAQALIPSVDLAAMLQALGVPGDVRIQVRDLAALKTIHKVVTTRPAEEVRMLLRWHVLTSRTSALGQPWRGLDEAFSLQRRGLQSPPPREREIVKAMGLQLSHPLSRLYVDAFFPDSTRREITSMVGHIKDEFAQRLRANRWLDETTRAAALDKLSRIDIQVGYPQQWIDFSSVVVRADDHIGNQQRADEFLLRRRFAQLGKPVVVERFADAPFTTPISVNAGYSPQTNSIDITAAIVQPPFYVPGADAAVNYCTIGAVIGHEITHGFDSNGRRYGPAGNLRDWWTPKASAEFKKRTDVLVRQYGGFTLLPGLKHNGELTLTENTADLGGITLANAALHRHLAGAPQSRIDGLTTDQRCFVAWAQMWAYKARPERIRLLAATDYHANATLRGFAPLVHLDAFHKAFGTRPGDAMWRAPSQRVLIW